MNTAKKGVAVIADTCKKLGIRKLVFSPGSRSAPLVVAFNQLSDVECMVIPDERVAGYFALGMAQQLKETVAVVCTSGTAVLNLAPAMCEAFYQHIPLLFLTADRPKGAVEKGENQAIDQALVLQKITNASFDVNADVINTDDLQKLAEETALAIHQTQNPVCGSVHFNIRLSEPLYETTDEEIAPIKLQAIAPSTIDNKLIEKGTRAFSECIGRSKSILLLVGMRNPNQKFPEQLEILGNRKDITILVETGSNLSALKNAIDNYDACLEIMAEHELSLYHPDMLITLGGPIISKRIKQFFKKNKPGIHWDIARLQSNRWFDVFDTGVVREHILEEQALALLAQSAEKESEFNNNWHLLQQKAKEVSSTYLSHAGFSDLKVFDILVKALPEGANVQYGNSTPIRYGTFFRHPESVSVNANRGTSGIDGCVSTAAGAAHASGKCTVCIVGDISFFYDSNALWNNYLSSLLRMVVINNSGGNIFRLIEGPSKVPDFERFFETKHHLSAKNLALMYDIPYYFCDCQQTLEEILKTFFDPQRGLGILEIKTDGQLSAEVYKGYFEKLRTERNKQQ